MKIKMKRLIIVSNRLPVTIERKKEKFRYKKSVGGLATAIDSFYRSYDSTWVGWSGMTTDKTEKDERELIAEELADLKSHPIFLSKRDVDLFYHGFSNETIWPLFHYFPQYAIFKKESWRWYEKVNRTFCEEVLKVAEEGDTIWIHDYHLMLLPKMLREKLPGSPIGFFLHIPFPSFDIFRLIPWRREILDGLLGADLIGFHTYSYTQNFLKSVHRLFGYEFTMGYVNTGKRVVKADIFPIGIQYERFSKAYLDGDVKKEVKKLGKKIADRKIILSVDRLDYTKGLPKRLEAFELFLKEYPEYRGKVNLIQLTVPSREQVEHYKRLKSEVDILISKINGAYGNIGWVPVWYLYRSLTFPQLAALYIDADVCLVTPLRDGMNLVAKEYVAVKQDETGVLILSEMAGAAQELGEAIIVNPNNTEEIMESIKTALEMDPDEKKRRIGVMQKRLKQYDVRRWAEDFFSALEKIKDRQKAMSMRLFNSALKEELLTKYRESKRRLFLLDYDGTLVPLVDKPEKAKPGEETIRLLKKISSDKNNEVVIISGRDKATMDDWFSGLDIGLVAEHGVWIKERGMKDWDMIEPLTNNWMDDIRSIFQLYTDRTPGSFIEEKEYSLVWHYRKVNTELGLTRVLELVDELTHLTANMGLQILEGEKVVEVKNAGVNKGRAAQRWIQRDDVDFILAAGDDWTDEDIFYAIPPSAYSIKVGLSPTKARYNLLEYSDVVELLSELG